MDNLIFIFLLIASALHIIEEYVFPGGFIKAFNNLLPRASHLFTNKFHIVVNSVFVLLCLLGTLIGKTNLVLSMSCFGLIFANAILHIRGAIVQKGYYPGVISAIFIYIPITLYAYFYFITSQKITWIQAGISFLLGVSYMVILMVYVLVQQRSKTDGV